MKALYTALAIVVLCLAGPIEITAVQAVPLSLQSLAVLVVPLVLGRNLGGLAVLTYVLLGLAGLPVFAEGSSGIAKLWGPTGGFIVGFVVAAAAVGEGRDRGWTHGFLRGLAAMLTGHAVILLFGFAWLVWTRPSTDLVSLTLALSPGLVVKSLLGAVISWAMGHRRRSKRRRGKAPR